MNIRKIPFRKMTPFEMHGVPDVVIVDCSRELESAESREAVRAAGEHLAVKPSLCPSTEEHGR